MNAARGSHADEIRVHADKIRQFAGRVGETLYALGTLRDTLAEIWEGDDHQNYAVEYQALCNEIENLEECLKGCYDYLITFSQTIETTQGDVKTTMTTTVTQTRIR